MVGTVVFVAVVFVGGALTFVYMFQIYQRAFLAREPQGGYIEKPSPRVTRALVGFLAALVLVFGLWPEPLLILGEGAAAVLTESSDDASGGG